jgi:hypothetical protein
MSRGWTAAIVVALIVTIPLFGACGSESSKPTTAELDRRSAAANRAAAVRKRAVVRRRAAVRAFRSTRLPARRNAGLSTQPKLGRFTTPTTIETQARMSPPGDLLKIQRTIGRINSAFRASIAAGIMSSANANHWVAVGVYSRSQCAAFETARGQGIVIEELVVHPESLAPAPGWVDPVIGQVPQGRIYQLAIDEIQTLITTGQRRALRLTIHASVKADGNARLFLRCA